MKIDEVVKTYVDLIVETTKSLNGKCSIDSQKTIQARLLAHHLELEKIRAGKWSFKEELKKK